MNDKSREDTVAEDRILEPDEKITSLDDPKINSENRYLIEKMLSKPLFEIEKIEFWEPGVLRVSVGLFEYIWLKDEPQTNSVFVNIFIESVPNESFSELQERIFRKAGERLREVSGLICT